LYGLEEGVTITPPERNDATFTDWYTEIGYTTKWDFRTPITENLNLYAKFTAKIPFTVTFDMKAGSTTADLSDKTVFGGNTVTKPNPDPTPSDPERFMFTGWYVKEDGIETNTLWNFTSSKVIGNLDLYAKYTEMVKVKLIFPDQKVQESNTSKQAYVYHPDKIEHLKVAKGSTISKEDAAGKFLYGDRDNGYTAQVGPQSWTHEGITWDWNTPVNGDIELTAVWEDFEVTFFTGYREKAGENIISYIKGWYGA